MNYDDGYIMLEKQLSNTEFCAVTNIAPATLSHILGKRSKPTLAILRNIVTGFPDLNPEWVLLGAGEMYRQPTSTSINIEEEHDPDGGASLSSSVTDGADVFEGMNDIFGNISSSSSPVRAPERPQQYKRPECGSENLLRRRHFRNFFFSLMMFPATLGVWLVDKRSLRTV